MSEGAPESHDGEWVRIGPMSLADAWLLMVSSGMQPGRDCVLAPTEGSTPDTNTRGNQGTAARPNRTCGPPDRYVP
jgi:hypothetical protein